MIKFLFFFISILIFSCSNNEIKLENCNLPVKYIKKKVYSIDKDYSISIPKNWVFTKEKINYNNFIHNLDASTTRGKFIDILSIQKIKPFSNSESLKKEYQYLLNKTKRSILSKTYTNIEIVESGYTNLLLKPCYFIHYKSNTGKEGEIECMNFLIKSKYKKSHYYLLNARISQTKNFKKNIQTISVMINCFKSFEENSKKLN
jgi:hypothetical protein